MANKNVLYICYRCCKIDDDAFKTVDSSSALPPAPTSLDPSIEPSSSLRQVQTTTGGPSGVPHPGFATPVARAACTFCTSKNDSCTRCMFCHSMGLRSRAGKTATELVASTRGLRCAVCRGFVCDTCLKVVINKVQEKRKRSLADDRWCSEVQECLQNGTVPEKFLGHCCEWALHKKKGAKAASSALEPRRYDGHLVLPQHGLLLDSPFNGDVDMHAFGNGDLQIKGVWHALVPEATAIQAHEENLVPDGTACSPGYTKIETVTIPGLGVGDEKTVSSFSSFGFDRSTTQVLEDFLLI
jgi:hypothetical protein